MSCCSEPGEILVVPETGGFEEALEVLESGPGRLPWAVVSTWDDFLDRDAESPESGETWERRAELRSAPFVVSVPEEAVEDEIARLQHDPRIVTATRNWRASLDGVGATQAEVAEFLKRAGVEPAAEPVGGGRPVRVAIVDSGVSPDAVAPGVLDPVQLDAAGLGVALRTSPQDPDGHGSTIARIVHHLQPRARITSIRSFLRGRAALSDIVYGVLLGRLLTDPVDIFNLSFSVDASTEICGNCGYVIFQPNDGAAMHLLFQHLRTELTERPLLVAAAGNAGGHVATPAKLLGVVAVGSTGDSPPATPEADPSYAVVPQHFVLAAGGSRAQPIGSTAARGTRRFGTSYATAVVTGLLAGVLADGDAYGMPDTRDELRWGLATANLRDAAWTEFPGYDPAVHGFGVLRGLPRRSGPRPGPGALTW